MATGDANDMAARVYASLPRRWFAPLASAPLLNAMLTGIGTGLAYAYSLLAFARQQSRLLTSTGVFVDLWAAGWFGASAFPRNAGETDAAYIARIQANLFVTRGTRPAFVSAMQTEYGQPPKLLIEPANAGDTGGCGGLSQPVAGGGWGCDGGGLYAGSLLAGFQFFFEQPVDGTPAAQADAFIAAQLPVGVVAWTETA